MLKFQPVNLNESIFVLHENGKCLGELMKKDDGYYDWWPNQYLSGYWPSNVLREIADKLDELNKPWHDTVKREMALQELAEQAQELDMGYDEPNNTLPW